MNEEPTTSTNKCETFVTAYENNQKETCLYIYQHTLVCRRPSGEKKGK